jgi:hypothetical protein
MRPNRAGPLPLDWSIVHDYLLWLCTANDKPKLSKDSFTVATIPAILPGTDITTKIFIYGIWHVPAAWI